MKPTVEEIIKDLCKLASNADEGYRQRKIQEMLDSLQAIHDMLPEPKMELDEGVNSITIGTLKLLKTEIDKDKTIGGWKKTVKAFADKHNLSDIEAINLARMEIKL